jgi:hypothetical protein
MRSAYGAVMKPNHAGDVRPKMPGQAITAVVLLWISTASGLFLTFVSWADHSGKASTGQDATPELVFAVLTTVITVATLAVVIGLHMRFDLARSAGLVLAVISIIAAMFAFVTTLNLGMIVNLAISGVLFGMLVSEPTNEWCSR